MQERMQVRMSECLLVGLGGGIGAMARYLMGKVPMVDIPYPVHTFVINLIGAFMIGLFLSIGIRLGIGDSRLVLFLTTGLCGGFSTLAALSAESLTMIQSGRLGAALLYCTATIVICVIATWAGTRIGRIGM